MIRRGLQFVCAVLVLLGAAPLYAYDYPASIVVTGLPLSDGVDCNGLYLLTGAEQVDSVRYYTQWRTSPATSKTLRVNRRLTDSFVQHLILNQANQIDFQITYRLDAGQNYPVTYGPWTVGTGSTVVTNSAAVWQRELDEYEQAFPDWESAAVKIPLGFAFGLALWASVLAFHVPMQWVRSLSERAT